MPCGGGGGGVHAPRNAGCAAVQSQHLWAHPRNKKTGATPAAVSVAPRLKEWALGGSVLSNCVHGSLAFSIF